MASDTRTLHVLPVLRPGGLALVWWLCVVPAAALTWHAAGTIRPGDLDAMGPAFWAMAALVLAGDFRPIVASGNYDPQGVNFSTAFLFATLVMWGLIPAALLVVVGTLFGEAIKRKRVWIALFNASQYLLSYAVAWLVLAAFGIDASPTQALDLTPAHLPVLLLAGVAYHLANLILVGWLLSAEDGATTLWDEFRDGFGYYAATTLAVLALSPLIVGVVDEGWPFILLLVPPLVAVYLTAQMSLKQEHQSLHDDLTGLANRSLLSRRLAEALDECERDERCLALAVLDLDRFKDVNDTLGHHVGDRLLVMVSQRIVGALRDGDLCVRLGGDEFAILLTDLADRSEAEEVTSRVRRALTQPFQHEDVQLDLDASIGIAFGPDDAADVDQLLRCADVAMYEAKESRLGVEVYSPLRDTNTVSRLGLLGELRRGIAQDELVLHYQPKVALSCRTIIGVEALVRWDHPTRGLLGPDDFLPLAEQSGLMRTVTGVVLARALAQAAAWRDAGLAVPVAVNVSVHDLADHGFVDSVADGLARHGLPASLLQLEVTEHALMTDLTRLSPTLTALDQLGVSLSLDDFGTGYSSLAHLSRLPVREVKIDRSFVQRLTDDDVAVMRAIVALGRDLGMGVVAEGVEDAHTWQLLRSMGCDIAQGWLLSRALPAEAATACLERHRGQMLDAQDTGSPAPAAARHRIGPGTSRLASGVGSAEPIG